MLGSLVERIDGTPLGWDDGIADDRTLGIREDFSLAGKLEGRNESRKVG